MRIIWSLIKGFLKFSLLALLGSFVLVVIEKLTLPESEDTSAILGLFYLAYLVLALIYVIKGGGIRRQKKVLAESGKIKQGVTGGTEPNADSKPSSLALDTGLLVEKQAQPDSPSVSATPNDTASIDHAVEADGREEPLDPASTPAETPNDVDFGSLAAELDRDEKFILMIGLLALYGNGEFSNSQIQVLRKVIAELDFSPTGLTHRDPTDAELCLDEKVAWALNTIRDDFSGAEKLSDLEINSLFKVFTESIEHNLEEDFKIDKERREYSNLLNRSLERIIKADGEASERERELLKEFKSASRFQLSTSNVAVTLAVLTGLVLIVYLAIVAIF